MSDASALFLFVTGAGTCVQTPALIRALVAHGFTVYSVLTPNVAQVTAPALALPPLCRAATFRNCMGSVCVCV